MRDILTSPRIIELKHKRRVRSIRLSVLFVVLFISIIVALSYFSSNHKVTINYISITGTNVISQDEVRAVVTNDMTGRYIHLFARANSFIYPHKRIYNDLEKSFPRIEKLYIYRDNLNTLHISVTERSGSYLYCGKDVPQVATDIGENCYFINNDGYIFDNAPYFSGNVYFKYYLTLPSDTIDPLGSQMLAPDKFHSLLRFIDGISALNLKPIYIVFGSDGINSLYLDHRLGDTAPVIMFNNDNDLSVILDNITVAMQKPEFANEINSQYNNLLYIDLRFNNKVLYKFQGQ